MQPIVISIASACVYVYISYINDYKCICSYVFMGRMQIVLPDELENRLRKKAALVFGLKKGSISKAIGTAIESWLADNKK
jgi:hypothetical protein